MELGAKYINLQLEKRGSIKNTNSSGKNLKMDQ
jgi:hypothetical protein